MLDCVLVYGENSKILFNILVCVPSLYLLDVNNINYTFV